MFLITDFFMAQCSLFVLKVPLNPNQPTNLWLQTHISVVNFGWPEGSWHQAVELLRVELTMWDPGAVAGQH